MPLARRSVLPRERFSPLARNRHAGAVASCLLLGEERKWLGCAPRSQFDPNETSHQTPALGVRLFNLKYLGFLAASIKFCQEKVSQLLLAVRLVPSAEPFKVSILFSGFFFRDSSMKKFGLSILPVLLLGGAMTAGIASAARADLVYNVTGTFGTTFYTGLLDGGTFSGTFDATLPANSSESITTYSIALISASHLTLAVLTGAGGSRICGAAVGV
jgi:hypothetical protein